jgi:hypothetical protein
LITTDEQFSAFSFQFSGAQEAMARAEHDETGGKQAAGWKLKTEN